MLIDEFFEASGKTKNVFELISLFGKSIKPFGYDRFVCFSKTGPTPDVLNTEEIVKYSEQEFFEEYNRLRCVDHDPVFHLMSSSLRPFTWDEVNALPLSTEQKLPMSLRHDFGLVKGFNVPTQLHDKQGVGLTIASTLKDARMDNEALAYLYAMTNQFNICRYDLLYGDLYPLPFYGRNTFNTPHNVI